tara:strand:+ start:353 stop:532 length:180 start_codon:yes stop_codon:yes gene_type:complete
MLAFVESRKVDGLMRRRIFGTFQKRVKRKKKTRQGMGKNTKYYTKESPNYKKRKVGQGG